MNAMRARAILLLLVLVLSACGERAGDASDQSSARDSGLPTPAGDGGVTGSADVAPGGRAPKLGKGPPVASPAEDLVIQDVLPPVVNPETGVGIDPDGDGPLTAPPAADTGAAEPTAADAVAVVHDYYAAINARDYDRAYGLWSDNGGASGQSPQQFAGGYAQTQNVSADIGAPGREDAGAGQRYIQVPVALSATQADGSVRRFAGSFVLHRAVVDGATPEQRSWRIQSADLREVMP